MFKKILPRLLVFFVGIPLVIALVLFDYNHHFTLHILASVFVFLSAAEMHSILRKNHPVLPFPLIAVLSLFLPITSLLCSLYDIPQALVSYVFLLDFFMIAFYQIIFTNTPQRFEKAPAQTLTSVFIVFYSGFLLTFVQRLTLFENATFLLVMLLLMVFLADSFAWFFGMLFGKNNRGVFKASPNKSVAGFIAGILASVAVGYFACRYVNSRSALESVSPAPYMFIGFCTAISGILGDLFESLFKREAGVKDSGSIIPGRGGALDSIDSLIFSAPVYTLLVTLCGI